MAEWSALLPPGDLPSEVEAARQEVAALRAQLPAKREALKDAQAAVMTAEADDRRRMAEELRAGRAAKADSRPVEKAQQRVAAAKREAEALNLAVQGAEDALGEVVHKCRDRWLVDARREEQAARSRARELVAELREALDRAARARVASFWLTSERGFAREARAPGTSLGMLAGSAKFTGNSDPLPMIQALDMLEQSVAEPEPQPPPESNPLRPAPTVFIGQ